VIDPHDVEERIAIRFGADRRWQVRTTPAGVLLVLTVGRAEHREIVRWWREVDEVADEMLRRARG
jgi:hypothetical protein